MATVLGEAAFPIAVYLLQAHGTVVDTIGRTRPACRRCIYLCMTGGMCCLDFSLTPRDVWGSTRPKSILFLLIYRDFISTSLLNDKRQRSPYGWRISLCQAQPSCCPACYIEYRLGKCYGQICFFTYREASKNSFSQVGYHRYLFILIPLTCAVLTNARAVSSASSMHIFIKQATRKFSSST